MNLGYPMVARGASSGALVGGSLPALLERLRGAPGLEAKRSIQLAASYFGEGRPGQALEQCNGDDAAVIADGEGYLLLAAEGMAPSFVAQDPWFAGFSAVMVNISDIAAMGGRPLAIVNVFYQGAHADGAAVFDGMRAASEAFGVPVVGGHTGRSEPGGILAAAILGRARSLISSFRAEPGDALLHVTDLRGTFRGRLNFNAATHASSAELRRLIELLPQAAELGLVHAGKDISMAGLLGTLTMLCEASGHGACVDLGLVPRPPTVNEERWLSSFPSYGYLLCAKPEKLSATYEHFASSGLAVAQIGTIDATRTIEVVSGEQRANFWHLDSRLTGFSPSTSLRAGAP